MNLPVASRFCAYCGYPTREALDAEDFAMGEIYCAECDGAHAVTQPLASDTRPESPVRVQAWIRRSPGACQKRAEPCATSNGN